MQQTTLQQRIEERAKIKLLKDLMVASNKELEIKNMLGKENYVCQLDVREHITRSGGTEIKIYNENSQKVFNNLLPAYISILTDELLQKIDEIDYLVNKDSPVNDDY